MNLLFTLATCIVALTGYGCSPAQADGTVDAVTVRIEPTTRSLTLGESVDLRVSVTDNGARRSPPLVIHLDITDPDKSTSVDPEDWTPTLSKVVGIVAPGETVTVAWNIQPISSGTFAVYAVALSPGIDDLATSNVLQVAVADQRTLNPGGILFVAIGAPAIVGALLLLQIRLARRTRSRPDTRAGQSQ